MNIQIKQRIVGVIIVVALIALLIPFLFVGKKNKGDTLKLDIPDPQEQTIEAPVPTSPVSANVPSTRTPTPGPMQKELVSITTPTIKAEGVVLPVPKTAEPASGVAWPVSTQVEVTANQDVPVNAKPVLNSSAPIDSAPIQTSAPVNSESIVKQEQNVMDLSPKQHAAKNTKNLKNLKKAKAAKTDIRKGHTKVQAKKIAATTGLWSVYLGNFPETEQDALVKKMHTSGYRAYAKKMKTPDGAFVGIYVGHLRTQEQAKQLAEELQKVVGLSGEAVKAMNNE